jgi:hypothetical protein
MKGSGVSRTCHKKADDEGGKAREYSGHLMANPMLFTLSVTENWMDDTMGEVLGALRAFSTCLRVIFSIITAPQMQR